MVNVEFSLYKEGKKRIKWVQTILYKTSMREIKIQLQGENFYIKES